MRWLGFFLGVAFLYTALLGVGHVLLGRSGSGALLIVLSMVSAYMAVALVRRETDALKERAS